MAELKFKDITEKIIGASFEVHKFLGNGFQEVIYQRALAWELSQAGLSFQREIEQLHSWNLETTPAFVKAKALL